MPSRSIVIVVLLGMLSACGRAPNPSMSFEQLKSIAVAEMGAKQEALRVKTGDHPRYDWNQDAGTIVFSGDGKVPIVADIQFVGDIDGGEWLWAWANDSIAANLRRDADAVRRFGADNGYALLTRARLSATEADGWDLAAVAMKVTGAEAVYRSPGTDKTAFLLLTNIRERPSADGQVQSK
jgi:Family of unknown function (DUF6882)